MPKPDISEVLAGALLENDQLRARVAELECRITDGFTGFSDGGLYAHIDLDADFYDSIPK